VIWNVKKKKIWKCAPVHIPVQEKGYVANALNIIGVPDRSRDAFFLQKLNEHMIVLMNILQI